jgi:[ribosomal protein S5]-alanine N-acetyltransferase
VEVEVGYRLRHDAWGQGFATEGARELVRYGFDTVGLLRIIGITDPDNLASQNVLRKCGLADAGWGRYYGQRLRVFAATNPQP